MDESTQDLYQTISGKTLLEWREEFPILERCVYLINNSLGAMPRSVPRGLERFQEAWATAGVQAWEDSWWNLPARVGRTIAQIIGAGPDEVSIQSSVTAGHWVAYSCLKPSPGRNKVVFSDLNFPSVRYFYQQQPELSVQVVESPDGISVPLGRMLEAIDETTLVVPISHVFFTSSFIQDAKSIVEKAHSVGAMVILDVYHSAGVLPLNVSDLEVDFAVGGTLKWLCGGPGVAFLYVRKDLAETLEPKATGWLAHERPFDFRPDMKFAKTAYRFMGGTPNIPGLHAAQPGLEIILKAGVESIRRRSLQLTGRIIELAEEAGIAIRSPKEPSQRGGHVTLKPSNSRAVSNELLQKGYLIDFRPGAGIRVAPHFFNTRNEVEDLMTELCRVVDRLEG